MKNIMQDFIEVTTQPQNLKTAITLSVIGVALCLIIKKRK